MLTEPQACHLRKHDLCYMGIPEAVPCSSMELLTLGLRQLNLLPVTCSPVKALLQGESQFIGLHNIVPTLVQEVVLLRTLTCCTNVGTAALLHTYVNLP